MGIDPVYLVCVDCDQIQAYIFSARHLLTIGGASQLIEKASCRETTLAILKDLSEKGNFEQNAGRTISDGLDWELIYATAGVAKVLFRDKKKAREFENRIHRNYRELTDSATVTTHSEESDMHRIQHAFQEVVKSAEKEIRRKKDHKEYVQPPLANPYFKRCEECGVLPAQEPFTDPEGAERLVCHSCYKKGNEGKGPVGLRTMRPVAQKLQVAEIKVIRNFHELVGTAAGAPLSQREAEQSYMGFLCADGNRMGVILPQITSSADLKLFVEAVEECLTGAMADAIKEVYPRTVSRPTLRTLVFGGDDLILVCDARSVFPLARRLTSGFHEKTRNMQAITKYARGGISMSAGVVIAKVQFPILTFNRLGHELMASAKRLSRDLSKPGRDEISTLDFMVVHSASVNSLDNLRREALSAGHNGDLVLTGRPYSIETVNGSVGSLAKLGEYLKDVRLKQFPESKLKGAERWLRTSKPEADFEYRRLLSRLSDGSRGWITDFMKAFGASDEGKSPFAEEQIISSGRPRMGYRCSLLDLVEMKPFWSGE